MNSIYRVARVSKQAYHKYCRLQSADHSRLEELIGLVDAVREEHAGCGLEKLYDTLQPGWLGRDRFISLFMKLGYRVKKTRNYRRTTFSGPIRYPNLIEGLLVWDKNRVWQTDITFYQVDNGFFYIVFIIDIYTKVIRGYQVSDHMRAEANIAALQMAFGSAIGLKDLIHHSDRGSQYGDNQYRKQLQDKEIHISMGLKGQDNAYAERINGTIKNEYLKAKSINSLKQLKKEVKKAVQHYNEKRIHRRLPGKKTPMQFERELLLLETQNRPKVIVYAEGNSKIRAASSHPDFNPETEPQVHVCPIVID